MDNSEARRVLQRYLRDYVQLGYEDLAERVGTQSSVTHTSDSGVHYQLRFETFWDDGPDGAVRVIGTIDDGTLLKAMLPLTEGLLIERRL